MTQVEKWRGGVLSPAGLTNPPQMKKDSTRRKRRAPICTAFLFLHVPVHRRRCIRDRVLHVSHLEQHTDRNPETAQLLMPRAFCPPALLPFRPCPGSPYRVMTSAVRGFYNELPIRFDGVPTEAQVCGCVHPLAPMNLVLE